MPVLRDKFTHGLTIEHHFFWAILVRIRDSTQGLPGVTCLWNRTKVLANYGNVEVSTIRTTITRRVSRLMIGENSMYKCVHLCTCRSSRRHSLCTSRTLPQACTHIYLYLYTNTFSRYSWFVIVSLKRGRCHPRRLVWPMYFGDWDWGGA